MIKTEKTPLVFLISGVARAGKDTFAAALMSEMEMNGCRTELFKFADTLKHALGKTLEHIGVEHAKKPMEIAYTEEQEMKPFVRDALVSIGRLSRFCDNRVFARNLVADVSTFLEFCPSGRRPVAVVADWRYTNEYFHVKAQLADVHVVTVHIRRPGYEAANEEEARSLADLALNCPIMHDRIAADPVTLRGMAKEIARTYL